MKSIFSVSAPQSRDLMLLFVRVAITALMFTHGLPKLQMLLSSGDITFPALLGMTPAVALSLAVFAEIVCSLFVLVGMGTRLAVVPLIITMLAAALIVHANDPFHVQEPALLYLLTYSILLVAGSGKYSADYYVMQRSA